MTSYLDAKLAEQLLRNCTGRDTRCSFASGCAFENISQISCSVLHASGEIGMAGARSSDESGIPGLDIELGARHDIFPMHEVPVLDHKRDRRAESFSMSNAGQDLHLVLLDLHTAAASVALLATP